MKFKIISKSTKAVVDFAKREWENADREHYGPGKRFASAKYIVIAYKNRRIS